MIAIRWKVRINTIPDRTSLAQWLLSDLPPVCKRKIPADPVPSHWREQPVFANLGGNSDRREILDNSTYDRIRGRATALLRREVRDHRLDPADLVHEAFLRIA